MVNLLEETSNLDELLRIPVLGHRHADARAWAS